MPRGIKAARVKALTMWAAGADTWDICEQCGYAEPSALYHMMWRARCAGDPRATKRQGGAGNPPSTRVEVVKLVRKGLRNVVIADRLGVPRKSVDVMVHTARVKGELPMKDRSRDRQPSQNPKQEAA